MAVSTFGVTAGDIHDHYFPSAAAFSTSTKPTAATVAVMIQEEGADLSGALAAEGISASALSTDAGATYPNAYAWCQDALRLGAAIRVMTAYAGAGAVPELWKSWLDDKYTALEQRGYLELGDAPAPAQLSDGPRWHGQNHNLDTGDDSALSTLIPKFTMDDKL